MYFLSELHTLRQKENKLSCCELTTILTIVIALQTIEMVKLAKEVIK